MIRYKDRWYCDKYINCANKSYCNRVFTEKVKEDAELWWKSFNLPEIPVPIDIIIDPNCYIEDEN